MSKIKKISKLIMSVINKNKTILLILILGFILRIVGFYPGYHPYHSDEGMSYSSALNMIITVSLDPGRYDYPSLIPIIHAFLYVFIFIPIFIPLTFILQPEAIPYFKTPFEFITGFLISNQQTQILFWARFITACFGLLVIWLTYYSGNKFFISKRVGLAAAFLVAVNYRQVLGSHLALPDMYNSFFLMLALIMSFKLLTDQSFKSYLLAIFSCGLFFSIKFQIFTLFPLIMVILMNAYKSSNSNLLLFCKALFSKKIILPFLFTLVFVLLIHYPFLQNWNEFRDINYYNLLKYSFGVKVLNSYAIYYLYNIGLGPAIFLLLPLGLLVGLRKRLIPTVLILLTIAPFFYIFLYYSGGGYYTRNFITITPLLLIFVGLFINEFVSTLIKGKLIRDITFFLMILIISFSNIQNSLVVASNYPHPWEFVSARNFASENIPKNSVVVSHNWDHYPRDKNYKIIEFETSSVYTIQEMIDEGAEYGYINLDWLTIKSNWWMKRSFIESNLLWERPLNLLKNTNSSAVSQEVASYTIADFVKPWQAPDMNILVIKIPEKLKLDDKKLIKEYNFNNEQEAKAWHFIDEDLGVIKSPLFSVNDGFMGLGCLRIDNKLSLFPSQRVISQPVELNEQKAYLVEGWIKSDDKLEKKIRDGMIRLDYYQSNPGKVTIDTSYIGSAVSSRYYGEGWQKFDVASVPPENATFMTINLEHTGNSNFCFDDISIYESLKNYSDIRKNRPYIDYRLPDDILFPYSQGGL